MAPLRPAMDVSVPQGDRPPRSDGNQEPVDLTETRIFSRLQGTQAVTVGGSSICCCVLLCHVPTQLLREYPVG